MNCSNNHALRVEGGREKAICRYSQCLILWPKVPDALMASVNPDYGLYP